MLTNNESVIIRPKATIEAVLKHKHKIEEIRSKSEASSADVKKFTDEMVVAVTKEAYPSYNITNLEDIQYYKEMSVDFRSYISSLTKVLNEIRIMPNFFLSAQLSIEEWDIVLSERISLKNIEIGLQNKIQDLNKQRLDSIAQAEKLRSEGLSKLSVLTRILRLNRDHLGMETKVVIRNRVKSIPNKDQRTALTNEYLRDAITDLQTTLTNEYLADRDNFDLSKLDPK